MTTRDSMQRFIERLATSGVAVPEDLRGCSPGEITALEQKYRLTLPEAYALFLTRMGRSAGKLVQGSEFDLYFPQVLELTEQQREFWKEVRAEDSGAAVVELPEKALIVCGRYSEQFSFLVCDRPDDSPVFYYNLWQNEIRQTDDSVFGFLEAMRADAAYWIGRGTPTWAEALRGRERRRGNP